MRDLPARLGTCMSRTIIQSYNTGEIEQVDLPRPALQPRGVVLETLNSVISPGTERGLTELARKSLLGKALARPDLVKQVFAKARAEGVIETINVSRQRLDTPIPLGYSVVGTVLEAGSEAAPLAVGQRVAGTGPGYANHAELNYIPRTLCVPVPDAVQNEHAAFAGLGAIALHAVRHCEVSIGQTVAVLGVGTLGLLAVQMLRASGAQVIALDLDMARVQLARNLGAHFGFDSSADSLPSCVRDATGGRGVDTVLIFASAPDSDAPMSQAATIVAERGRIVAAGNIAIHAPRKEIYEKEITVTVPRAAGPGMYDQNFESGEHPYPVAHVRWSATENLSAFLQMVEHGSVHIDPLITHRLSFNEILSFYAGLGTQKTSGALGVVVDYPSDAQQTSARKRELRPRLAAIREREIGVGVLGSGLFTRTTLLPVLSKLSGFMPRAIASRGGLHALVSARKYNFEYATTNHREILDDRRIDAVIITTRHDQHAQLAVEALEAGKHVLVEKPLAMTQDDLLKVLSAAEQRPEQLLMVGFNRRFAPTVSFLQENLTPLTEPFAIQIRVNAGYIPQNAWVHGSTGGGRVHAEICHYIDLAQGLSRSLVTHVYANAIRSAAYLPSDNVAITLTLANGGIANILYTGAGDKGYSRERIEIHGNGCSAEIDGFKNARFIANGRTSSRRLLRQDYGHSGELTAFLKTIADGDSRPVDLDDYATTTWATFAIERSLETGKAVDIESVKATAPDKN